MKAIADSLAPGIGHTVSVLLDEATGPYAISGVKENPCRTIPCAIWPSRFRAVPFGDGERVASRWTIVFAPTRRSRPSVTPRAVAVGCVPAGCGRASRRDARPGGVTDRSELPVTVVVRVADPAPGVLLPQFDQPCGEVAGKEQVAEQLSARRALGGSDEPAKQGQIVRAPRASHARVALAVEVTRYLADGVRIARRDEYVGHDAALPIAGALTTVDRHLVDRRQRLDIVHRRIDEQTLGGMRRANFVWQDAERTFDVDLV